MAIAKQAISGVVENRQAGNSPLTAVRFLSQHLIPMTDQPVTLDHLLKVPDLFRAEEPEVDPGDLKTALMTALAAAHQGLHEMKDSEGAALVAEMKQRLTTLAAQLVEVEKRAPEAAVEIQARIEERLGKLLTDQIDPQRLAQEVALLAEVSGRCNQSRAEERFPLPIDRNSGRQGILRGNKPLGKCEPVMRRVGGKRREERRNTGRDLLLRLQELAAMMSVSYSGILRRTFSQDK